MVDAARTSTDLPSAGSHPRFSSAGTPAGTPSDTSSGAPADTTARTAGETVWIAPHPTLHLLGSATAGPSTAHVSLPSTEGVGPKKASAARAVSADVEPELPQLVGTYELKWESEHTYRTNVGSGHSGGEGELSEPVRLVIEQVGNTFYKLTYRDPQTGEILREKEFHPAAKRDASTPTSEEFDDRRYETRSYLSADGASLVESSTRYHKRGFFGGLFKGKWDADRYTTFQVQLGEDGRIVLTNRVNRPGFYASTKTSQTVGVRVD